jgi:hypothetical protein
VSDAEAAQEHVDEQGSPEAPRDDCEDGDDGEQALAVLNASTDESSAIENGVEEGDHNSEGGQDVECQDSDVEIITAQVAESREESEGDINAVELMEEQQGTDSAHHSGEDDDDDDDDDGDGESVSGNTEPPENGSEGM